MISATLGSGLRRLASTLALAALVAFAPAALAQTSDYNAILSGSNEVPAVESGATGRVGLQLNGTTLVVTGSFQNLESAYNTDIGAHLHIGGPTENGPVDIVLNPTLGAQQRSGQFQATNNTFELTQEQIDRLDAGGYYVNVHSVDNPTGEVRGQVLPLANVIPIADARAMGTGMEVTIEGTVSRALGQFAYLQDETAGITIRQPSGDLFEDIADGDIGPGTVVRITGTTSEFRQLFQINDGDLTAYEVRGQSTAPQPQVVTLADLAATGEDFEGELVRVTGAT
ncbi:MAG: CHRD domain-containing protein, partial [Bacteroidota bacterium]